MTRPVAKAIEQVGHDGHSGHDGYCHRYFAAHLRGSLSLQCSFWVNFALLSAGLGLAVGGLTTWVHYSGNFLRTGSALLLLAWPLTLALALWGALGAWRSASAYAKEPGRALIWPLAAKTAVVLGSLTTLASTAMNFAPRVGEYFQLLLGTDPLGHLQATISPDGRRLQLQGPVGVGDASRVTQLLATAPRVRLVELQSPGGRLHEAHQMAAAVRSHGWQTRAIGVCENACALIFLAGSGRQVVPGAGLGFHRLALPTFNLVFSKLANRAWAANFRQAGLPESFITNILGTSPTGLWTPGSDELAAADLVGVRGRPLDVPLPDGAGAAGAAGPQPSEFADALLCNLTWQALERWHPGTIDAAALRMAQAQASGAPEDAVQVAGQRVVEALLPALQAQASAALREQFIVLLGEQLAAVRSAGPEACRGLLARDAAARRSVPAALAMRESAWLVDTASDPAPATPARRASRIEVEVVRRSLGERAPALLVGLLQPARADGRGDPCELPAALIAEVMKLPPAERRLAIRLIFTTRGGG